MIEQDVDYTVGNRYNRWWAAYGGGGSVTLPLMMVGSGYQIATGYLDFYTTYKNMIEAEKARPPLADVTAYYERVGGHFDVSVIVTNQSGVPLSYLNQATIHLIVYEEAKVNITGRFVRTATSTSISEALANGDTATYNLTTGDIAPLNWDKVHVLALVDYRPDSSQPYDTLQSALATESVAFSVTPDTVVFMVEPTATAVAPRELTVTGPPSLAWQMSGGANWLTVTPTQGDNSTKPQLSIVMGNLVDGWQETTVNFAADVNGQTVEETVLVKAYQGQLAYVYLPTVMLAP